MKEYIIPMLLVVAVHFPLLAAACAGAEYFDPKGSQRAGNWWLLLSSCMAVITVVTAWSVGRYGT